MKCKLLTIAVAALMVLVGCAIAIDNGVNATPQSNTGSFNVYSLNTTVVDPQWVVDSNINAYDGCEAISGSTNQITFTNSTVAVNDPSDTAAGPTSNSEQKIGIYSTEYQYTYYYPNPEYGDFSSYDGLTNDDVNQWNVFIYNGSSWVEAAASIGWYKPFADYGAVVDTAGNSCATANIALVYGSNISAVPNSISSAIQETPLKEVVTTQTMKDNSIYEYKFTLKSSVDVIVQPNTFVKEYYESEVIEDVELTSDIIKEGITVIGYGSDANLALINAVGSSNIVYQNVVPGVTSGNTVNYYGWYSSIFGKTDSYNSTTGSWNYWSSEFVDQTSVKKYCDFSLAYYSNFDGAYNGPSDTFTLTYV